MKPRTFDQLWNATAPTHAERPFLLFRAADGVATEWSYTEFDNVVSRAAALLRVRGVGRGDSVHVALRNSPAFVALWLATARIGAWLVPVDPGSPARDIARQVQRAAEARILSRGPCGGPGAVSRSPRPRSNRWNSSTCGSRRTSAPTSTNNSRRWSEPDLGSSTA